MTTLITGSTGFVGKLLLKRLLLEGQQVRALVRDPSKLGNLVDHPALEIFQADLEQFDRLPAALQGIDRLYHSAAVVKEWVRDWSVFDRVNVKAHRRLLDAALDAGVKRIVHTSSFIALGHSDGPGVADETAQHEPGHFHNPYERTKYQAMRISEELAAQGAPIVMVLPGIVFGPGELTQGNLIVNMLSDWAAGRLPALPGPCDKPWSYAYVGDVVNGHMFAMERGKLGERYILGGENKTMDQLFAKAAQLSGRKPPRLHLPLWLLKGSAAMLAGLGNTLRFTPPLVPGTVGVAEHAWAYSSQKAIDELGYTITPFDQALETTIHWMQGLDLI
ncbi:MAG: NAD-dependent epimerase/dehydratase family protein [Candidatus Alcyoniella australis]|nr:NAD-dependent epimerase/dehydratase family protein [Candidatus Alcyoniella australis]